MDRRGCSENGRVTQRVVTAGAYDEVRRTLGNARELLCKACDGAAINCTERGPPTVRQSLAQLSNHVRRAAHISSVVEDGVT
jgi:hypothetical protein